MRGGGVLGILYEKNDFYFTAYPQVFNTNVRISHFFYLLEINTKVELKF